MRNICASLSELTKKEMLYSLQFFHCFRKFSNKIDEIIFYKKDKKISVDSQTSIFIKKNI